MQSLLLKLGHAYMDMNKVGIGDVSENSISKLYVKLSTRIDVVL